jgi:hypothetical protein
MEHLLQWINSNTLPKNKTLKRAVQILPEVYGTTLNTCFKSYLPVVHGTPLMKIVSTAIIK